MTTILEIAFVLWIVTLMLVTGLYMVVSVYEEVKYSELFHKLFKKKGDTE